MTAKQQEKLDKIFGKFNIRAVLALSNLFLCFSVVFALMFVRLPTENREGIFMLAGILFTTLTMQHKFFFETSLEKNQSDKVKHLNELENSVSVSTTKTSTPPDASQTA